MGRIIFILGGARSGKSTYALELAKKYKKVAFIATCQGLDAEMKKRIRLHQKTRPKHWSTFEESNDLEPLLMKISKRFNCAIIDCLTLWVSNLILGEYKQGEIIKKVNALLSKLRSKRTKIIMVSNEVGLGIVPAHKLGRDFRDIAGKVNQLVAKEADEVFFMVSGIPWRIKCKT